jgi:predicted HicB family RNase H-like nuclease
MKEKKRKAGRPKLPKNQVKNVIAIRVTDVEKREYEARAEQAGLSLSDWIRQAIQHA